jgi:hypothetical protein
MGLIDLLQKSSFGLQGETPKNGPNSDEASTLHNEYSINGKPKQTGALPRPSTLDLQGKVPAKYTDNLPK